MDSAGKPTRGSAVAEGTRRLRAAGVGTPRLDAELLLCHVLGLERVQLLTGSEIPVAPPAYAAFQALLDRRQVREPLPYLIGWRPFLDFRLHVAPGVLIPRPETELLVEMAAASLPAPRAGKTLRIVDVGAGSGAIAAGIARLRSDARVCAMDVSEAALKIARRNIEELGLSNRVEFAQGDLLDPAPFSWRKRIDAIVCNPPYIPSDQIADLQPEVLRYEPRLALDGGTDGLAVIRRLIAAAPEWLADGGILALEMGAGQAAAVGELLGDAGYTGITTIDDMAGIPRVCISLSGRLSRLEMGITAIE